MLVGRGVGEGQGRYRCVPVTTASLRWGKILPAPPSRRLDAGVARGSAGFFDPHTHIGNERSFGGEAETGTRAAVLGGVTTIGIFIRRLEGSYLEQMPALRRTVGRAQLRRSRSFIRRFSAGNSSPSCRAWPRSTVSAHRKCHMSGIPGIVASGE